MLMTSHKCDVGKQHVTTVHRSLDLLTRDNLLEPSYLVLNMRARMGYIGFKE